ncbi:diadenylate cyclase [Mycoplasmopsis gallinacea]|uniref:Diadenylate cyclase n=1 Tax=Mycoplasmopsis gallinacea TaxID=29556 RepID=A0A449A290_9BACT|nr:DNA integrity scanning protein DisA nucleotide-binding domain protein [Mycoplasmopsis gallinacea]QIW62567.1 diadenylate cyclase [Mycoplasmopsis gallinacea]VEU58375.1 membrane protein [Mycoplasmopsis gallinacea]
MHQTIITLLIFVVILLVALLSITLYPYITNFITNKFTKSKYDKLGRSSQIRLINQLRETVENLSRRRVGALITIENNDNIDNLRTDGIVLNANISSALLIAIFNKNSPLHDGAVVIRDNKIYYAATFYKITRKSLKNSYGSRHRAAFGISEQCDATTIVVSEETGKVILIRGDLHTEVKIEEFQEELIKYLKD